MAQEPQTITLDPKRPTIVIMVGDDGIVRVRGTINDKIVAYGLLKAAEIAIAATDKGSTPRITIPSVRFPTAMNG